MMRFQPVKDRGQGQTGKGTNIAHTPKAPEATPAAVIIGREPLKNSWGTRYPKPHCRYESVEQQCDYESDKQDGPRDKDCFDAPN